jgi:hypothetical protein
MTPTPKKPLHVMSPAEYEAWKVELARWYADVWDSWALGAFQPLNNPPRGSVPIVPRRR